MAMMDQKMLDYFIAKWVAATNGPAVFIPYEPATTLYCIGGVADGEGHLVPSGRSDLAIPERPKSVAVNWSYDPRNDAVMMETRSTWYRRRLWKPHPDLPIFEFLAPSDWTFDQITDHLTGGKYGCDRRPRPQAPSHPAKASDPVERAGRTGAITIYNTATDTFRTIPIEDAGTRAGEITAWRCWELRGPRLGSTYMTTEWDPVREMAGDVTNDGVHAFKHPLTALAYMLDFCENPRLGAWRVAAYAFGSVDLYGEVIEHEIGYRAQYARVASIESAHAAHGPDCSPPDREALDHMLNAARDLYGVAPPGPRA